MVTSTLRRWLGVFRDRSDIEQNPRNKSKARLALERLEGREVPSNSIPLNNVSWTQIGPLPIVNGEAPGRPAATGRFDSVAVDATNPNVIYAASAVGGIWRTTDGGNTWSPRTDTYSPDTPVNSATYIRTVHRDSGNTIYALSQDEMGAFIYYSTDGGTTFIRRGSSIFTGRTLNEFVVRPDPTDPTNPNKDIIFVAAQSNSLDPMVAAMTPSGIYRSTNGGQNWTNITATGFPFPQVNILRFSDIDIDPLNTNVVYASVNFDASAQTAIGMYRCTNAMLADGTATTPGQWELRLGGSAFFPAGTTPFRLQTAISPVMPSVVFVAVMSGPTGGNLIALYRSTDTGINWTPLFPPAVPNFTGGRGLTYSRIFVDPSSPLNPAQQIIYAAGFGDTGTQVVVSRDSGTTWRNITVGFNGVGPYVGVRDMQQDSLGRIIVATEGGVYRLRPLPLANSQVIWDSLNGTVGPNALNTVQVAPFGVGLHPTNPNIAIANIGPTNGAATPPLEGFHSAVRFNDSYGWQTIDSFTAPPFHTGETWGVGPVFYNFNVPNTVFRTANAGTVPPPPPPAPPVLSAIRRSNDGGNTWAATDMPVPDPTQGQSYSSVVINPSNANEIFTTQPADDVYMYNGTVSDTLENLFGSRLPSLDFSGGAGTVTAIGVSRQSNLVYVAVTEGIYEWEIPMPPPDPPPPPPLPRVRMYVISRADNIPIMGGGMTGEWVELSLPVTVAGSPTNDMIPPRLITQILVDPNNPFTVYFSDETGRVWNSRTNPIVAVPSMNPAPPSFNATVTWQQLNLTGGMNMPPQSFNPRATGINAMVLDPNIVTVPGDDRLYVATNSGVYSLLVNQTQTNNFVWQQTGGNELPNNQVTDLDINTTTGILSVGLNGRGVWQYQIRTQIRGQAFHDVNGNGVRDTGEPGLRGPVASDPNSRFVYLLRDTATNSVIASTITDDQGFYEFRSVPLGTFTVEQVQNSGWTQTTALVPTIVLNTPGQNILGEIPGGGPVPPGITVVTQLVVGNFQNISISGVKFQDINQDGIRQGNEAGLPGFTIFIDTNDNSILDGGELSTTSGGNGSFIFTNLGPASVFGAPPATNAPPYRIREVVPLGWIQTTNPNNPIFTITPVSNTNIANINVGNFRAGSINGRKFFDVDADGAFDPGEIGLSGWTIFLDLNLNGTWESATEPSRVTDSNGFFEFTSLAAGTYRVREVQQVGWTQTTPNPADIVLTGTNSVGGLQFGNFQPQKPWEQAGPSPIRLGEAPGQPSANGRFDSITSDPTNASILYAASIAGGIWRSTDGGVTWSARTDTFDPVNTPSNSATLIRAVHRNFGNTVYAASTVVGPTGTTDGFIYLSTDGASTFTRVGAAAFVSRRINEFIVVPDPTDPENQSKDLIYAAVQTTATTPAGALAAPSGVYRSTDGGLNWTNITANGFPFAQVAILPFNDIDIDPTNKEVVYASVNFDASTQSAVGMYRCTNAFSTPATASSPAAWDLRLGGSAFFSGALPFRLQTTVSKNLPSVIFVSATSGNLLAIYRSTDTGINWTPLLSQTFQPPPVGTVPDFTQGSTVFGGNTYSRILVDPNSPLNPTQQILYAGGFGDTGFNVMVSQNSGVTWQNLAVGNNGIGPYTAVRDLQFDAQGRLLVATEGGVYRLNATSPQITWQSINGTGAAAINSTRTAPLGLGLHPTDPNQALVNGGVFHAAAQSSIDPMTGNVIWQTVDGTGGVPFHPINPLTGLAPLWGMGTVIYDFSNPNTIYRMAAQSIRRTDNGGATWFDADVPFTTPGAFVMDPSDSRLLFSADIQDDVYFYDALNDASDTIENALGAHLPSLDFVGGPGTVTAIGISRQTRLIYAATTAGIYDWETTPPRTRLYVLDTTLSLAPDWIELNLPVEIGTTQIRQIMVDPNNPFGVYFFNSAGRLYHNRTSPIVPMLSPPGQIPPTFIATVVWDHLNTSEGASLPPQNIVSNATGVNVIGLDPNVATNPNDDQLFVGTNNGVFSLLINPTQTNDFVWQRVGGLELPNRPVTDLDVNTTTGELSVGLDGRGVWKFQIRSLIQGRKFNDTDGDGIFDAGEPGIGGFVINLIDNNTGTIVASTTTNAQGFYEFRSVPAGTYFVREVPQATWVQTTALVPVFTVGLRDSVVPSVPGQVPPQTIVVPELNIGTYRRSSIAGQVYEDVNQNGVRNPGEAGVPGFIIYIDFNNNGVLDPNEDVNFIDENGNNLQDPDEPVTRVVSDAGGNYVLRNLGPAVRLGAPSVFPAPPYTVRQVVLPGWIPTTPNPAPFNPNSGQNITNVLFGVFRASSISGIKFNDINANGIFDAGEPGLANWQIYIDANLNGSFDSGETNQLTDVNGFFQFQNLAAGTYRIREVQQTGWVQTTANPPDITLTGSNSANNLQFGNFFKSTNSQIFANWTPIGPAPQLNGSGIGNPSVSGRIADIAVDPTNPNRYFITAAGGGIWRTTTGGNTWVPLTNNIPGLTVFQSTPYFGEVAIAPSAPNTIYAASGEAATGNPGKGFLKSTDGGDTWTRIIGPGGVFDGSVVTQIIVDRNNANLVFASVSTFGSSGVWRTLDGGTTWTNTTEPDPLFTGNTYFSDIQVDVTNPNVVYAAVGAAGGDLTNGIYRTSNALAASPTWTLLIGGSAFVPGALPGNIRLALSPTQPSTIYALLARATDPGTGDSEFLAMYKSSDSGVNWTNLVNTPSMANAQGSYNFAIAVHPTNPNVVVAGGDGTGFQQSTQLIVGTNDGGITWRDMINGSGATLGPHTDIHSLVFDKSGRLLAGTDGGMFRLNNATLPAPTLLPPFGNVVPNWVSLNGSTGSLNNLNTIQFIGIATHPTNPRAAAGGSQDNGIGLYQGDLAWLTTDGGDAGEVIWDFDRPNILYHIAPIASVGANNYIQKSVDGGLTWAPSVTGINGQSPNNTLFYPPIIIDPSNSMRLFTGTDKVWVTDNGGVTWDQKTKYSPSIDVNVPDTPLSGQNPPIPIQAIGVGRPADTVIFVSQGGSLLRIILPLPFPMQPTMDDWIDVTPPGVGPFNPVVDILLDPTDVNVVYALVGAPGSTHVWRSNNLGGSWQALDGPAMSAGRLPDLASYSIAIDPRISTDTTDDILYVGNDNGVWGLFNPAGANFNWFRVGQDNMPVAAVFDLDLNTTTGVLAAGTHGRGVWETRIRGDIQGQAFEDINGNAVFDAGEPVLSGVTIRVLDATPGPSFGTELATTMTDATGFYEFPSLRAGNYFVVQVTPNGFVQTTANPGAFLDFTEQSVALPAFVGTPPATFTIEPLLNFGSFRRGSISGVKFEDRNGNGTRETGEPGLAGFVIYIDANNNLARDWTDLNANNVWDSGEGEQWIASDLIGNFTLPNIGPQFVMGVETNPPYIIREIQQVGFQQTSPTPTPFTITSGQNVTGVNVGNIRIGRIEGFIFNDFNGNGIQDVGDTGLGGMTLQLVDNATGLVFRTLVSDPDGTYEFLSIPAGSYQLRQALAASWIQTFPAPPNPTFYTINLAATDQVTGFRFGNFQLFSISGIKFEDLNGNGIREAGENGVPNFVIQVTNLTTGSQTSAVTDAFGNYTFNNLGPGVFQIREVQKPGWLQTTTDPADIQGTSGTNRPNTNFGNFRLVTATGVVFNDLNGNGIRDQGEAGLPGFTVFLDRGINGTIDATAVTDANGNYSFGTLGPASYVVRQQARRGWTITGPITGDYTFTAISSINPTGLNFGNTNTGTYAVGQDSGGAPTVSIRRVRDNVETLRFNAYAAGFRGGVRVASGFTEGNTIPVVVTAAGPGGGPHVRVWNSTTGEEIYSFFPFDPRFTGGVHVAIGDVNADGFDDIVVAADAGGGPHVKVISGQTRQDLYSFFAYAANFTGGVRVSTGDVDGDGRTDIITGAGPGGGPHVKVFSGATGQMIRSFFAYSPAFTGGVFVAGGDFNGDGRADIATGAGRGGGPHARVFHGTTLAELASTFAYEASFNGGVRVFAVDANFDNRADLITAPGPGRQPLVKAFSLNGGSLSQFASYNAFDPSFLGGVWVG